MKLLAAAIASLSLIAASSAQGQQSKSEPGWKTMLPLDDIRAVAPGVVQYTTDVLFRDLWLRPDLAPRDRSLVTVSALITSTGRWIMA
ncbi:MAG: carboxymuconolactone decarboxylase family protein [Herminiimonas sp.]|nr:carboxymuconolactone decarboxylase family protein [Herminiimonas sp.]